MSLALRLERVSYRYPGAAAPALSDIDLQVAAGEFVVLAGSSGSGKSTLLRAAAGLVPHFHGGEFTGRLEAGGLDTRTHEPADIAAVAGTLFQDPETQIVMGTVRAELAFPLENRGFGPAAVARGVEEAALALGIASGVGGWEGFDAYPRLVVPLGAQQVVVAIALVACVLLPFADRRGIAP